MIKYNVILTKEQADFLVNDMKYELKAIDEVPDVSSRDRVSKRLCKGILDSIYKKTTK